MQRLVELGAQRSEQTPWVSRALTRRQLQGVTSGLWTFMGSRCNEPNYNAAERALLHSMIHRKISHGVQLRQGAICSSRLLTGTTTLHQQGRDIWQFLEQAWTAHHRGGVMPLLLPR